MRILKNILSQVHIYLIWLILGAVLWGWIFSLITDAPAAKKVTVFIDAADCRTAELEQELERDLPAGIRMVKVHLFSYAMFDENGLLGADIYIVPVSRAEGYRDSFLPTDQAARALGRSAEGFGIPAYDAAEGRGAAASYVLYRDGEDGHREDYVLFFGVRSLHACALTGKGDDAALAIARRLLEMDEEARER